MICHHHVQNRERTQIVPIELPCIDLHCHNEILPYCHNVESQSGRNDIQIEKSHIVPIELYIYIATMRNCYNDILPHYQTDCHAIKGVRAYKREQVGADNLPCKYQTNQPQITKYTNWSIDHLWRGSEWPREFLACLPPRWLRTSQNWFSNEISHSIRASFQAFLNLSAKLPRRLNWDWDWADERSLSFSMMVVDRKSSIVKQVMVSLTAPLGANIWFC